ncbi:sugar phosphate isomerase/epimerase family protein [Spirosoma radiotolerans]|uniref:Endonuclease n=1 Tax=Spirosoma radiotolerans TaxID=1379870 RepID=A0A0E4A134_9BACT|nr:sugar phosphate isomerase/epimerase family protein [Spirosoma radiotolerans]AKD58434.1 endonuclease [Spirosoma radiotolerans]
MDQLYPRRHFLKQTALAAGVLPLLATNSPAWTSAGGSPLTDIHIFSKHLQFLNYADMADAAAEMGFKGVDLTVRPDGHVRPERVEDELPKAVESIRKAGLTPKLMTTTVGDATNAIDMRVLKAASKAGFQLYRMKWYQYDQKKSIPDSILTYQQQLRALGEANKTLNLIGCYQNHAGLLVGSSVWELWEILKLADPVHTGIQYDIRHATVEGGQSWPNGLRLLQPQIKSVALKDFRWSTKNGVATVEDVPLGEGMVDFKTYFKLLKQYGIQVPISLHIEHPTGGAEHGATKLTIPQKEVFAAMKRDLNRLQELWTSA